MTTLIRGAIVGLAIILASCTGHVPAEPFSKEAWLKTPELERAKFADDLIARNALSGLSEEQVASLLGTPSFLSADKTMMSYVVGRQMHSLDFNSIYFLELRLSGQPLRVHGVVVRGD